MEFIGREQELESMERMLTSESPNVRSCTGAHGRNIELVNIEELYA